MCNKEFESRKGKVVCSTTCRVDKFKAFKECDKLLAYFLKNKALQVNVGLNAKEWKEACIKEIVAHEGKIGVEWNKARTIKK
jgi:hypothetical protein